MDYGKLAQLSAPGASPLGSGIVDPLGYRRWMNLDAMNQQALQKSVPLADMDLQRSQQQQQEYMAGAPGRMDNINLSNMTAAAGVKNFDADQFAARLGIDVKNAENMAKLADVTQDFAGDADAYFAALNSGDERLRNQIVKKHEGRKLRNGYVMGTDPNTDDAMIKIAGIARAHAPALVNKKEVEQLKGANRLTLENMKNLNDKEKIELRGQIAGKLQGDRIAAARAAQQGKPMSASQALAAHLNGLYGDDHESWLKAYSLIQEASTTLKIDEKAAALRMFPELAKRMGEPAAPRELPPGNPNVQAPTKPSGKVEHPDIGKEVTVSSKTPDGKETQQKGKIVGITKSGKKVLVQLPDGREVVLDRN